jgi:hypothetical protein
MGVHTAGEDQKKLAGVEVEVEVEAEAVVPT